MESLFWNAKNSYERSDFRKDMVFRFETSILTLGAWSASVMYASVYWSGMLAASPKAHDVLK